MKRYVNRVLAILGYKIISIKYSNYLSNFEHSFKLLSILRLRNAEEFQTLLDWTEKSKSQLFQDLFVIYYYKFKQNGYFVEFGATNGLDLSNTWLLEKEFGWQGILSEPGINWHSDLFKNRTCKIEKKAVWSLSNVQIEFLQSNTPEHSTFRFLSKTDYINRKGKTYFVETISLLELLDKYEAPRFIDYLSIDTEGSEFPILDNFDFQKYKFGLITVEHNYTFNKERINSLLLQNGYKQILNEISMQDDWYSYVGDL